MPTPAAFDGESDDRKLVANVIYGDEAAFRRLIIQYERLVVSIVFKMIIGKEDREDLCQDVFLKVYEKLPAFRFGSKLSTWIGSISFNACVNFLQKRKPSLLDDLRSTWKDEEEMQKETEIRISDLGTTPEEQLMSKEKELLLLKSIEQLSVIQKTVIQLFHQNELSLQEVSEITGLPVSTVKSHLFRARKKLKEEMSKH